MTATDHPTVPQQRKRTGRPALTDRAALLRAARGIGFADLTIGRVTHAAGVKYSTCYRHYRSLDELTGAMVADVLAEVRFPGPDMPWRDHLHALATALAATVDRWPGLADAIRAQEERPAPLHAAAVLAVDVLIEMGVGSTTKHEVSDAVTGVNLVIDQALHGGGCEAAVQLVVRGLGAGAS